MDTAKDIAFVLSGGAVNDKPNLSLGGLPSSIPVVNNANENLFSNITPSQASSGKTDYRCFYIFNDSLTYSLSNVHIWLELLNSVGAHTFLGTFFQGEIQTLTFSGGSSGSFQLQIGTPPLALTTPVINYSASPTTLASNIQSALISTIGDLVVSGIIGGSFIICTITFNGINSNKAFSLLTVTNNTTGGIISVAKIQTGNPINSVAPDIGVEIIPPRPTTFYSPTLNNPLLIGSLRPNEGFPVWIQRVVGIASSNIDGDGISIKMNASAVTSL